MIPINAAARAMHATASASERLVGIAMSICARTLRMSVLALAFLTACTEHAPLAPATDRTVEPVANTARQIGHVNEPASAPPAVVVRDDRGQPIAGARVTFTVTSGGGRVERAGVTDLDEMESITPNPDLQVVVQGEFSPQHLGQAGCQSAQCVNLPNWNTFRYIVQGRPANVPGHGPAGQVADLTDNRDMTDPAELAEFIAWAKLVRPAEHYMLVLWNHGGRLHRSHRRREPWRQSRNGAPRLRGAPFFRATTCAMNALAPGRAPTASRPVAARHSPPRRACRAVCGAPRAR